MISLRLIPLDRATIDKSSTLPHDSAPRVTSPAAVEGKINQLKEIVKQLEEREAVAAINFGDDAPIKGRSEGSVPTGSEEVPTASLVFATATVATPVTKRKGKEVMMESKTPKKQKVQEQIDAQVAKELEEQLAR
nr:hypothetical protein [Tanacetum cinerariifolium]